MSTEQQPADAPRERFAPKHKVDIAPPKDDPISVEYLSKCNGQSPDHPTYVAIKGRVFNVTGNKAYGPDGPYKGADASRALGKTSTKAEDVSPDWHDLPDSEKQTLDDWYTFFSKRYAIVGLVEGASNME